MPGEPKRKAVLGPGLRATLRDVPSRAPNHGNPATGPPERASNTAVLYFSRRRPRGLSSSGSSIFLALPITGKVNFYRAEIRHWPGSLAGDGKSAVWRLAHLPSGGSVCP